MKHIVKIAKYSKIDDNFMLEGFDEYNINYLFSKSKNHFRIVINGILSNVKVNILPNSSKKTKLLEAIRDYKNDLIKDKTLVNSKKFINLEKLKISYTEQSIFNIKKHLLTVNKEVQRDILTLYQLY